jgi:hypothetical protein
MAKLYFVFYFLQFLKGFTTSGFFQCKIAQPVNSQVESKLLVLNLELERTLNAFKWDDGVIPTSAYRKESWD